MKGGRTFKVREGPAWWLLGWSGMLWMGVVVSCYWHRLEPETTPYLVVGFVQGGCRQLGLIGLVLTIAVSAIGRLCGWVAAERAVHRANVTWLKILVALTVAFLTGEAFLRVVFFNGASFTNGSGPINQRFRQVYSPGDRFRSHHPDTLGPKRPGQIRLMIQGDSITWGQGIKDERAVWPSVLLNALNAMTRGRFEMVVLARGDREIDGHLRALQEFGRAVEPDVIIYEWHPNDMELTKSLRPVVKRQVWTTLFFHELFVKTSYAWWFLHNALLNVLWRVPPTYPEYLEQTFAPGTLGWQRFETLFRAWLQAAHHLTPRVIALLYPMPSGDIHQYVLADIHERVSRVAGEHEIQTIDFIRYLGDMKDWRQTSVSRFDTHPNEAVHWRMAQVLLERLQEQYPELFLNPTYVASNFRRDSSLQ